MKTEPAWRTNLPTVDPWALLPVLVWMVLFNIVGAFTWGYGRRTFVCLLAAIVLQLSLPRLKEFLKTRSSVPRSAMLVTSAVIAVLLILFSVHLAGEIRNNLTDPGDMTDIPLNTYAAGSQFLEGHNPYAERTQLWGDIPDGPHVTHTRTGVKLFGIRYYYGYPYFPVMFLSYLPFRELAADEHAMRFGNLFILLTHLVGVSWLAARLVGDSVALRRGAVLLALSAYLCVRVYGEELFLHTIVDILMASFALYAYIALTYRRYLTAGVLLGLMQACKLLPGPLVVLPVLIWLWRRDGFWRLLAGYVGTSLVFILPFLLWDPEAFLSGTTLFYLVYHAGGDNTAMYFFLPPGLRPWSLAVGGLGTVALLATMLRRRQEDLVAPLQVGFVAYLLFVAFGKMTHLNYIWGIWPLGCVALVVIAIRGIRPARG